MSNEIEILDFFESEFIYDNEVMSRRRRRLLLRTTSNPFHLDEEEFIKRYRLTKSLATSLCEELRPIMKQPRKVFDLPIETKVLTALSFYATGSYQRPIGNIAGHSLAQQTVSTAIAEVTTCLNSLEMRQKYIPFPANTTARNKIKTEFYNKFKIPGVLGCIDCTHVAIIRPALHEERFFCRKHYHSLNVQLICDANMNFISVDASYGGANHDSFIWTNHPLKTHLETLSASENVWLLGDSGYPLRRYMMTPILNALPDSPEAHYTHLHVRARNTIERAIGLLKARFRSLLVHRTLHYAPEVAGSIVNACVILHNICNSANIPVPPMSNSEVHEEFQAQVPTMPPADIANNNMALLDGITYRNRIVQDLYSRWQLRA